jgi:hypothetical protein
MGTTRVTPCHSSPGWRVPRPNDVGPLRGEPFFARDRRPRGTEGIGSLTGRRISVSGGRRCEERTGRVGAWRSVGRPGASAARRTYGWGGHRLREAPRPCLRPVDGPPGGRVRVAGERRAGAVIRRAVRGQEATPGACAPPAAMIEALAPDRTAARFPHGFGPGRRAAGSTSRIPLPFTRGRKARPSTGARARRREAGAVSSGTVSTSG